ncbi:MAG TPA: DinB family protein [Jatrophihabitantaceae bacterium]|nr:DinB family protein [Jatrophihabitantaceae bacterium]
MSESEHKDDLHRYLRAGREALLWKLDGLDEYDVRRPLVPTGTNLLGLVKHLAAVEWGYFALAFDRPMPGTPQWFTTMDDDEPNVDMWARADESRDDVVALYRTVTAHADETIASLDLDATGRVPWWPAERREATLHRLLVHTAAETHRHAGHADIVRELIDGAAGLRDGNTNMPPADRAWWDGYRDRLQSVAEQFRS